MSNQTPDEQRAEKLVGDWCGDHELVESGQSYPKLVALITAALRDERRRTLEAERERCLAWLMAIVPVCADEAHLVGDRITEGTPAPADCIAQAQQALREQARRADTREERETNP